MQGLRGKNGIRQYRTKPACRLCTQSACRFFGISHKNPLTYDSMPAEFLCNLPKNLTTHLTHKLCAVLPKILFSKA